MNLHETILYVLSTRHEPIQRHFLLNRLHVLFNDLSDRSMRAEVEKMVTIHKIPIGTCEDGYFLIRSREDLTRAQEYLNKKAASIAIRKNCLEMNYLQYAAGDKQLTLI